MEKTNRFVPYYFILFFIVFIGCFYKTYFGLIPHFEGSVSAIDKSVNIITPTTHFHAVMVVLWLLLLIVQPILIIKKKTEAHRLLGKASYVLVGLLFLSFLLIVQQEQMKAKNLIVFNANLFDVPVFMAFYGLAIYTIPKVVFGFTLIVVRLCSRKKGVVFDFFCKNPLWVNPKPTFGSVYYRKNPAYHSRFMIMSIIPFLDPALARIPAAGVLAQLGLWAVLFTVEAFNRKNFKPYLIGFGYYVFNLAICLYFLFANQALLDKIWHLCFG